VEARYWDLVEPIWESINIDSPTEFQASFVKVPRPIGLVYASHFCLSEVHNGGFLQFFWNSTGVLAPEAGEGFEAIGMPQLAAVVQEVMLILGDVYPRDREVRWDALLRASQLSDDELERIFKGAKNLYHAYAKATKPLPFDALNKRAWELAAEENGDFGNAATQYLTNLGFARQTMTSVLRVELLRN
jgi:hypothetical protein